MKQAAQHPMLLLLRATSIAGRRKLAELVRDIGGVVVAEHGHVALEVRLTNEQGRAADDLRLFTARLTGPMSREAFEDLTEEERLYVRQWNSRFRPAYREMLKRPENRGLSWGSKGFRAPLPYSPFDRHDLDEILRKYEDESKSKLRARTKRKTRTGRMTTHEFIEYERALMRTYKDENAAYVFSRAAYNFPEYRDILRRLPPDLLKLLVTTHVAAAGKACIEMTGLMAVGLVFAESSQSGGPKFAPSERDDICGEIIDGLGWLAEQHPTGDLAWVFDLQFIGINVANQAGNPDESYWRDPAVGALNYNGNTYAPSWAGLNQYREDMRVANGANFAFVIFATPFNSHWFAYASSGRVTLSKKDNWGGWGRGALNCITAHETSHIFGAADEYTGSGTPCSTCGSLHGCDAIPNGNCGSCAHPQQSCVMDDNDLRLCAYTKGQIGWSTMFVELTTADIYHAGTDDTVWLDIGDFEFELDTHQHDDRERGNVEGYAIYAPSLQKSNVKRVLIRKSSDGEYGGWRLARVRLWFQGELLCDQAVNQWLEDDTRFWVGCVIDATIVNSLVVNVTTADVRHAGTDDAVTLKLAGRQWQLDNQGHDDFERGHTDTFNLDPGTSLYVSDIHSIQIAKAPDGDYGGWKLHGVELIVDGVTVFNNQSINKWLENADRTWSDVIP